MQEVWGIIMDQSFQNGMNCVKLQRDQKKYVRPTYLAHLETVLHFSLTFIKNTAEERYTNTI